MLTSFSVQAILFEKIYYPYLLVAKKRYAGILWTRSEEPDKKDVKGMESVRRDNCILVKETIDTMIKTILIDRNLEKMVNILVEKVKSVSNGTIDLSKLIISKALSKDPENYNPRPPQAQVALKMRARNPHTAPKMGDRVPYVITAYGGKKEKISKKAEHPIEVINHSIPVDKSYYIDRQLRKPCERILEPLLNGITNKIFSNLNSTVYIPTNSDSFTRKMGVGMGPEKMSPTPAVPAPPPPPPKPPAPPAGKRAVPKNKVLPILAGQTTIFGAVLRAPERKITDQAEGCVKLDIKHSIKTPDFSRQKGLIGAFTQVIPTCIACDVQMKEYIKTDVKAPPIACFSCSRDPESKEKIHKAKEEVDKRSEEVSALAKTYWDECVPCQKVESVESLRECASWECKLYTLYVIQPKKN